MGDYGDDDEDAYTAVGVEERAGIVEECIDSAKEAFMFPLGNKGEVSWGKDLNFDILWYTQKELDSKKEQEKQDQMKANRIKEKAQLLQRGQCSMHQAWIKAAEIVNAEDRKAQEEEEMEEDDDDDEEEKEEEEN